MEEIHARNLILLLMVFMQNFHAFNCRSERVSAFKVPLKRNIILVFGVLAAQGIHILSMQIPFMQKILRVEPVTFNEWLYILALAVPMIFVMEVFKLVNKPKGIWKRFLNASTWHGRLPKNSTAFSLRNQGQHSSNRCNANFSLTNSNTTARSCLPLYWTNPHSLENFQYNA